VPARRRLPPRPLAATYGSEIALRELLARLTGQCPHRFEGGGCTARFTDLDPPMPPPDLPRTRNLRVKRVTMCGRIIRKSGPLQLAIVEGLDVVDSRYGNVPPRYNGAPNQTMLVIRQNHQTGERSLDLLKWGLIPYWCEDAKGGRKPINAKAETVSRLPMFRDAYQRRRCIVPVDGFFEWRSTKGGKQPYAIAMKDGSPFGSRDLGEQEGACLRRMDQNLRHHHRARECAGRRDSRSHAGDPDAGEL
jgi:hypothetical protein